MSDVYVKVGDKIEGVRELRFRLQKMREAVMTRDVTIERFIEAAEIALDACDLYPPGMPIDLLSSMGPLRHALKEAKKETE
jgi:hypothetical protein